MPRSKSHLWWRGGWQVHLHCYHVHQSTRLILGAYSLSASDASLLHQAGDLTLAQAQGETHATALQAVLGFSSLGHRFATGDLRAHILAPHSLTLFLQTDWLDGEGDLLALSWAGPKEEKIVPWTIRESAAGCLALANATGETWEIRHPAIPSIDQR